MKEYTLSLILAALICGLIPELLSKGTTRELTKMACGIVLVLAVVSPLRDFDWQILESAFVLPEYAYSPAAKGEDLAQNAMADIIKAETEAYILDKAAELGAEVTAQVSLSGDPPLPVAVVIRGDVPPDLRSRLQEVLCTQLGFAKENLTWTGET